MNFGIFGPLLAQVSFGTLVLAFLGVFAALVAVEVVRKGCQALLDSVGGGRVWIGGGWHDKGVVDSAFESIGRYKKAGGSLDKETARQYRDWRNERARSQL